MSEVLVILAGGQSKRMGTSKAFVELDRKPLLWHIIGSLGPLFERTVISDRNTKVFEPLGYEVIPDAFGGDGSLVGICSALKETGADRILVVACDMPLVKRDLARFLLDAAEGYAMCIPRAPGGMEPLFAVYDRKCLEEMENMLEQDERKIIILCDRVATRVIEEEEWRKYDPRGFSFKNANTRENLIEIEKLYNESKEI